MSGVRYFTDRLYGVVVAALLAGFLGYSLSAWLRRTGAATDMVDLAGDQVGLSVVAVAVGATLAALISARHHRRAGRDLWATAARSPLRLSTIQFLAVAAPVLGGWFIYLVVTTVREGSGDALGQALPIQFLSLVAVATGVALGQVIGLVIPAALAAPVAFAFAYLVTGVIEGAGDDYWWQWLGPGFGDGFSSAARPVWLAGELLWLAGVTAAFVLAAAVVSSYPRRLPALPATLTALALIAGAALLFVNGPDASSAGPLP